MATAAVQHSLVAVADALVAMVMGLWVDSVSRQRRVMRKLGWDEYVPEAPNLFFRSRMGASLGAPDLADRMRFYPYWLLRTTRQDFFAGASTFALSDAVDDDLILVGQVKQLKSLSINHNRVTDAGLACLDGLTQLEKLQVYESRVNGSGLRHLRSLSSLTELYLGGAPVTNEGLAEAGALASLQVLAVDETHITDAGLAHLRGMQNLRVLWLNNNAITDAGLEHLGVLKNVKAINLRKTLVTLAGIRRLRATLPHCHINWDDPLCGAPSPNEPFPGQR